MEQGHMAPSMTRRGAKRKKGKDATKAKVNRNAQKSLQQGFTRMK